MSNTTTTGIAGSCGQLSDSADILRTQPCVTQGEYGEPWTYEVFNCSIGDTGDFEGVALLRNRYGFLIAEKYSADDIDEDHLNRAQQCVNAMADIADPIAYLANLREENASMREMLRETEQAFQKIICEVPACIEGFWFWPHISPDGDYLGEIPADPASAMQGMQVIAEDALAKLQSFIIP